MLGPGAPLCVHPAGQGPPNHTLYCAGSTQQEALATMRAADRLCRLSRMSGKPRACDWTKFAAPTQGAGPLPTDIVLPASQCLDDDNYCAIRESIVPLAAPFVATGQRFTLVNPGTSPPTVPKALLVSAPTGLLPSTPCPGLLEVNPAVGPGATLCAGIAPTG